MIKDALTEREFELVNIVGAKIASNQRDLSRHMDLSLGMTNMLIHRLISKGFIRIKQLNKRKVEYILTPKGFSEKLQKSIKYTVKTINSIGLIKDRVKKILLKLHGEGKRSFLILGKSDLATLLEMSFKENHFSDCVVTHIQEIPQEEIDGVILICTEIVNNRQNNIANRIDLIETLARENNFINLRNKIIHDDYL